MRRDRKILTIAVCLLAALAIVAAVATALLRLYANKHRKEDVLVGSLVGVTMGSFGSFITELLLHFALN